MKGYKATNGNYITGKEIEAGQKKFRKENGEFKAQYFKELEQAEKLQTALICQDLIESIHQRERQTEIDRVKDQIYSALQQNNPFTHREYLIVWDMLNFSNFYQIQSDYNKGRINKQEINKAMDYIDSFSDEIINPNFRENLLSLLK